jgi:predicted RNase H-like HicB family nuclease
MPSLTVDEYMALHYTIMTRLDDEGDWLARIKEFDGCMAHADTLLKALRNLHSAQRAWIEVSLEAGLIIPMPDPEW